MEDWPPNGHFTGAVGQDICFISGDDLAYTSQRKDTSGFLRHRSEIGHFCRERGGYGAVSCAVQSVAGSTMSAIDVFALERVHQAGGSLLWSTLGLVVKRSGRCRRKKPPNQ